MRRSSRATVQDSSRATVSLRKQDLQMKAQPKKARGPAPKRDRLLDVPLTQEWLASSGRVTSRVQPIVAGGHRNVEQPKMLFRDHEQVWAKVKGSPWWPAVVCPDADGQIQRGRRYHVVFFGDQTEGYCMPDNICNFELNLGSFRANNKPAKASRKLEAAIEDALAELKSRGRTHASFTATRSLSPPPAVPSRKRAKNHTSSGIRDEHNVGAHQSISDVLHLLQQAAYEIERADQKELRKSGRRDIVNFVTPQSQNLTFARPECLMTVSGRTTPPLNHSAASDLVQLSIGSSIKPGLMQPVEQPVEQLQQPHPKSAFCSISVKDACSAKPSARRYEHVHEVGGGATAQLMRKGFGGHLHAVMKPHTQVRTLARELKVAQVDATEQRANAQCVPGPPSSERMSIAAILC